MIANDSSWKANCDDDSNSWMELYGFGGNY